MPQVVFDSQTIECEFRANLRQVLLQHKLPLYNGIAAKINCRGFGTCGTCAVEVDGPVTEPTRIEKWRLGFPPHQPDSGLRLACQCLVLGDLKIEKYGGMWGNKTFSEPES